MSNLNYFRRKGNLEKTKRIQKGVINKTLINTLIYMFSGQISQIILCQ